jgi:hypothetical protein
MAAILITPLVGLCFMAILFTLWMGAQLLSEKRLGFRAQGCKGPVRGTQGEALCCKGGGRLCDSSGNGAKNTAEE